MFSLKDIDSNEFTIATTGCVTIELRPLWMYNSLSSSVFRSLAWMTRACGLWTTKLYYLKGSIKTPDVWQMKLLDDRVHR